jgi:1,4-dihydroxy-2-naphthoate octaprenyltransferase
MTFIAYTVGALAASIGQSMSMTTFLLGYLTLFLVEVTTVFVNEWFDFESDRTNRNAGPFTGGSRVLVDGRLDWAAMRKGIVLSGGTAIAALVALVASAPAASASTITVLYAVFTLLAVAYTVPPLQLSHRGFGEVDVALTHSAGAIMAGYVAQGGGWTDSGPWFLALPLGVAVLPSILLAGCPDRDADRAAGKRTLVVILGMQRAVRLAMAACLIAPLLATMLWLTHINSAAQLGWSVFGGTLHGFWLFRRLRRLTIGELSGRIDGAIVLALTFILWFCVPQLVALALVSEP